jgi:periplasmic protein TonB
MATPGYTLLHLDEATADATAFGERKSRFGGAVSTSVATHALLILVFWGLTRVQPAVQPSQHASVLDITKFVFRGLAGPSGGGGGGGNESTKPAVRFQTHPADAIAVTVADPTPQAAPDDIAKETPPLEALVAPVQPLDAGRMPQVGTVDGPSAPPTDARGPGTRGGTETGNGPGTGPRDGPGYGPGSRRGPGIGDGPPGSGDGVRPPHILYKTSPQYTTEAMRAKIQGVALLSGVVGPDGTLQDIRIARSVDGTFGLDQEAIKCVRQWRFQPGMRSGKPVAVAVTIEVGLNLR